MSDELLKLRQAVKHRAEVMRREDARVDSAVLDAYRATRGDGTPENSLAMIGEVLGVTRQRAFQLVREVAARSEQQTRT